MSQLKISKSKIVISHHSHIHFICPDIKKCHCPFSAPGNEQRSSFFTLLHFNFNCINNMLEKMWNLPYTKSDFNFFFSLSFSFSPPLSLSPFTCNMFYWTNHQGGSMPNTSSSVPFLLSNSMQSIRSRRTSTCLSSGPLGSGSGLLQQLGSGMVRQLTSVSGTASPVHHQYNGNSIVSNSNNNSINNLSSTGPPTSRGNYVRKCPSLNITFSTH